MPLKAGRSDTEKSTEAQMTSPASWCRPSASGSPERRLFDRNIWVGLDVSADALVACAVGSDGVPIAEAALPSCSMAVARFIVANAGDRDAVIGIEAGSHSIGMTRKLRGLGFTVHAFETRQASRFLGIRRNKTDRNDAKGLADLVRLGRGVVSEVYIKSVECQQLRSKLVLREKLLRQRIAGEAAINSIFRLNNGRLKRSYSNASLRQNVVKELERIREVEGVDLSPDILPVMEIAAAIRRNLEVTDRKLMKLAASHPICGRFMAIPGVGPVTALSFYSAIEDPTRFRKIEDVGAYFGLAPRVRQSGDVLHRLGVSRMGNSLTRKHLLTASSILFRRDLPEYDLWVWARSLAERASPQRARTALARKLAMVMLSLWKSGESYRSSQACGHSAQCHGPE